MDSLCCWHHIQSEEETSQISPPPENPPRGWFAPRGWGPSEILTFTVGLSTNFARPTDPKRGGNRFPKTLTAPGIPCNLRVFPMFWRKTGPLPDVPHKFT